MKTKHDTTFQIGDFLSGLAFQISVINYCEY